MIRRLLLLVILAKTSIASHSQADTSEISLEEVVVKAYEQSRTLRNTAAAVVYVGKQHLDRFAPSSLVMAVNTTPGVRMEERSPGSYRINIRGSAQRSPFGVRNVKIYYNDLPFTTPGGQSYLNQLGFYNIASMEIIKGPGSSLYGAGTGGVMLIESLDNSEAGATVAYTAGSFGLHNVVGSFTTAGEKHLTRTTYQRIESEGYRNHSGMKRDVLSWNGSFRLSDNKALKTSFLYGQLFYETPGALTAAEYNSNAKAARPGSETAMAAIFQNSFLAGASYVQNISSALTNKSVLYAAFTELDNPNLRGFDRNSEPHVGGRSVFTYSSPASSNFSLQAGAEWQQGFTTASTFKNVAGAPDSLRFTDKINNRQSFLFAQATLTIQGWLFTAGASLNQWKMKTQRFSPEADAEQRRIFNNELAPRLAILKTLGAATLYSSISKGFSPPTVAELLPTGSAINLGLQPEDGINYDIGLRTTAFEKLYIDVNAFIYRLKNTIVQRRDALGGDFYINAGKTKQHGVESYISYPFQIFTSGKTSLIWVSYTWHNFHYREFSRLNEQFSGNKIPGIAPHQLSAGTDLRIGNHWKSSLVYQYSDKMPLNDANSAAASSFHLFAARFSYTRNIQRFTFNLFTGADNLFDQKYSLGNDINAFGGRFFNAAPGRNFYAGVNLSVGRK
jgi:iron complex outermembrane receptor protein